MSNPTGAAVVRAAMGLVKGPEIPYVWGGESMKGMDCQGFVEVCVRQSGGKMSYAGSNDMFRNACRWVGTIAEAKAQGRLAPGAAVFVLKKDGTEPERYQGDGVGNASHVGLYCGEAEAEVAHSSSAKGKVCATTLAGNWTHVGLLKAVEYGETEEGPEEVDVGTKVWATVWAESGSTVNLRQKAEAGAKILARVPIGEGVLCAGETGNYTRVAFGGMDGYMESRFLRGETGMAEGLGSVPVEAIWALVVQYASGGGGSE